MGLFDFFKTSGQSLFSREEEAAKKIHESINANNPGIKNLKVDFKKNTVFLSGEAQSPEALQKAVLMAGNIQGVETVNVDGMKVTAGLKTAQEIEAFDQTQYYVIQPGDTLSKIAQRFYGNAAKYGELFEANREVIRNPNLIFPGQKIRIPKVPVSKAG